MCLGGPARLGVLKGVALVENGGALVEVGGLLVTGIDGCAAWLCTPYATAAGGTPYATARRAPLSLTLRAPALRAPTLGTRCAADALSVYGRVVCFVGVYWLVCVVLVVLDNTAGFCNTC